MNLYTKPAACKIEGHKIGIFVGASYRYVDVDYARELIVQVAQAIAEVDADIAAQATPT